MGTSALTRVKNSKGAVLLAMYRQCDGYVSCQGVALAKFLASRRLVNGLTGRPTDVANGPGCLAAQLVATLKTAPGNHYLVPADTADMEWTYDVDVAWVDRSEGVTDPITVTVKTLNREVFKGNRAQFSEWVSKPYRDPDDETQKEAE